MVRTRNENESSRMCENGNRFYSSKQLMKDNGERSEAGRLAGEVIGSGQDADSPSGQFGLSNQPNVDARLHFLHVAGV